MDIHWLDGLILVIILISLITGAWRGFIKEVLSLVAWVAAFLIARAMSPDMAVLLKPHISSNSINLLVSWLIPFLGTFIVFHFLKMLLISVITLVGLRPVDRLFGALFGAARGILVVTALILVTQLVLSRSGKAFETDSKLVPHFQPVALWFLEKLDEQKAFSFEDMFSEITEAFSSDTNSGELTEMLGEFGLSEAQIEQVIGSKENREKFIKALSEHRAVDEFKRWLDENHCLFNPCE